MNLRTQLNSTQTIVKTLEDKLTDALKKFTTDIKSLNDKWVAKFNQADTDHKAEFSKQQKEHFMQLAHHQGDYEKALKQEQDVISQLSSKFNELQKMYNERPQRPEDKQRIDE